MQKVDSKHKEIKIRRLYFIYPLEPFNLEKSIYKAGFYLFGREISLKKVNNRLYGTSNQKLRFL